MADRVLIVGSGFAGFWAAVAARRVGAEHVSVTLVAPTPELVIRPRLYQAQPESLAVDLEPLLEKIDVAYRRDRAVTPVTTGGYVVMASGDSVGYERLIVATGSVMRRPPIPGVDLAHSIDSQAEAVAFDRRLAEIAGALPSPVVAVVGAGFTGIELALELRDRVAAHGGSDAGERLRIVLIDRADVVGPELGPAPRPVIEAALDDAHVERHLGRVITRITAHGVELSDGSRCDADVVVLTTGLQASPFVARLPGEHDESGRVIVDPFLRMPEAPHVLVAGDVAAADTGDGHRALQSCQHALQLGRYAGENAARDLLGLPLVPYAQLRYVTCLDLGRSGAVLTQGWDRSVLMTGAEAKARKVSINTEVIYPPLGVSGELLLRQSELDPSDRS